ncbi:MAG TPA: protein kinase [Chlamydiales bacterium]|nr:protein kinase [Chlamydiales bacterium]
MGLKRIALNADGTLQPGALRGLNERVVTRIERWPFDKQKLGSGTYGQVWRFKDALTGGYAAGKINEEGVLRTAEKEREFLHRFQSVPHVVKFYGGMPRVVEGKNALILYMELLPATLRDRLEKEGKLPFEDVLSLSRQLLEFHAAFTDLGWIHCDLTTRNCSFDSKKKKLTVFDFGMARPIGRTTSGCQSIQSILCRAPEVFLGRRYHDGADLWSIGCSIFAAFAGERFVCETEDDFSAHQRILAQMIRRLEEAPPDFFEGTKFSHESLSRLASAYEKYEPLPKVVYEEACKRGLSQEVYEKFLELLEGILTFEDRLEPHCALQRCNELIALHAKRGE